MSDQPEPAKRIEFTLTLAARPDGSWLSGVGDVSLVLSLPLGTPGQMYRALEGALPPLVTRLVEEATTPEAMQDMLDRYYAARAESDRRQREYQLKRAAEKAQEKEEGA